MKKDILTIYQLYRRNSSLLVKTSLNWLLNWSGPCGWHIEFVVGQTCYHWVFSNLIFGLAFVSSDCFFVCLFVCLFVLVLFSLFLFLGFCFALVILSLVCCQSEWNVPFLILLKKTTSLGILTIYNAHTNKSSKFVCAKQLDNCEQIFTHLHLNLSGKSL
jgi:hypothetical protein